MQADVTIHEPQKMVSRSLIFDGEIAGDEPTRESGAFWERLLHSQRSAAECGQIIQRHRSVLLRVNTEGLIG